MLSHSRIWSAIDLLAKRRELSSSGLARRAGLDPTTFNRSKRVAADGRPRWPLTESIAKILEATGAPLDEFIELLGGRAEAGTSRPFIRLPLLGHATAGKGGYPTGQGWEEVAFPAAGADQMFALKVTGDSMLPLYREGDVIIVSPTATTRRGDRVVLKTRDGEVMAKVLEKKTAKRVELLSLNPDHQNRTFPMEEVDWIARIIWASQ